MTGESFEYRVNHGDWLSKIALKVYGDVEMWHKIHDTNSQITDPNVIHPGDIIKVPLLNDQARSFKGSYVMKAIKKHHHKRHHASQKKAEVKSSALKDEATQEQLLKTEAATPSETLPEQKPDAALVAEPAPDAIKNEEVVSPAGDGKPSEP
jgi:hypothetical protein